jgi:hypothetical protein
MDEELVVRPGFNLDAAFRRHLSAVRHVAYNPRTKQFLSFDEHSLKVGWLLGWLLRRCVPALAHQRNSSARPRSGTPRRHGSRA